MRWMFMREFGALNARNFGARCRSRYARRVNEIDSRGYLEAEGVFGRLIGELVMRSCLEVSRLLSGKGEGRADAVVLKIRGLECGL